MNNIEIKPKKKSCIRIAGESRCAPHIGPMDNQCKLSDRNRCVFIKQPKSKKKKENNKNNLKVPKIIVKDTGKCENDGQIQAFGDTWEEMKKENRGHKIIQLKGKNCYDIDELVAIILNRAAQGLSLNWDPASHDKARLWTNLKELDEILDFPNMNEEDRIKLNNLSQIINERALLKGEKTPEWIKILAKKPNIVNEMAEIGLDLLGDYTDDFVPSYKRLTDFRELLEKEFNIKPGTNEKDYPDELKIIEEMPCFYGATLKKMIRDVNTSCIHGGGMYFASFYIHAFINIRNLDPTFELHPGFKELTEQVNVGSKTKTVDKNKFIFGYPYLAGLSPMIHICYYDTTTSQGAYGGSGRIGGWLPDPIDKYSHASPFNYSDPIIKKVLPKCQKYFEDLKPYYLQRLYDVKNMQKKLLNEKKANQKLAPKTNQKLVAKDDILPGTRVILKKGVWEKRCKNYDGFEKNDIAIVVLIDKDGDIKLKSEKTNRIVGRYKGNLLVDWIPFYKSELQIYNNNLNKLPNTKKGKTNKNNVIIGVIKDGLSK